MKKVVAIIVALIMFIPIVSVPGIRASAFSEQAYVSIVTASDFQASGVNAFTRFSSILEKAKTDGLPMPDGALFGGDYATASGVEPTAANRMIIDSFTEIYPDAKPDKMVFVEGNHDLYGETITPTGFYDMGEYLVYSINEDDYKTGQASRSNYGTVVQALSQKVGAELDRLIKTGDKRPVFIITHVPMHHSSRSTYGDCFYSSYLFDVINSAAEKLDIVFLFGHNHSSSYDDYIGGAVNYLAKGDIIRIPVPDLSVRGESGYSEETLNFTYMNCGYVGYSNNANSGNSVNALTMGIIELCPESIEVTRYTTAGLYSNNVITRINPLPADGYAQIYGNTDAVTGSSDYLYCDSYNLVSPEFTWVSDSPETVRVTGRGEDAFVEYLAEGTANISVSVESDGVILNDVFEVNVTAEENTQSVSLTQGTKDVSDNYIYKYSAAPGSEIRLEGSYAGFSDAEMTWSSSEPQVAYVSNGVITVAGEGKARIDCTVSDGENMLTESVTVIFSSQPRQTETYLLSNSNITAGKKYVIASSALSGYAYAMVGEELVAGGTYNVRLKAQPISVVEKYGTSSITAVDDSIVWTAVDIDGELYFRSELNGRYLSARSFAADDTFTSGRIELLMSSDDILPSGRCSSVSGKLRVGLYFPHMSSDGNFRASNSNAQQVIYELMSENEFTALTLSGMSIDGNSFELRSVSAGEEMQLTGAFSGFEASAVGQWASSDNTVAEVDGNGKVTFTGNEGKTSISYTVSDGFTQIEKSVEIKTFFSASPIDVYVPTDTLEVGKSYIITNTSSAGSAYAMLDSLVFSGNSNDSRFERRSVVIEDVNGTATIKATRDNSLLWTAEQGENGEIYLRSENCGEYLSFVKIAADELFTSGRKNLTLSPYPDSSCVCTIADGFMKVAGTYYVYYSGEGNFRANSSCSAGKQQLFVRVDETRADIEVGSVSVNKTNRSSTVGGIELLTGSYACFGENVSGIWSSDNESVAGVTNGEVSFKSAGEARITYTVTDTDGRIARCYVNYSVTEPETEPPTEPETEPPTEPETEPPTEPETEPPTEPETEPPTEPEKCSHICHSDSAVMKFFWGIMRFFYKLFGIKQNCECGIQHY